MRNNKITMTANQSNQLVNSPSTKKAIAILERYAKAEAALKELEEELKQAVELIKQSMIQSDTQKIVIDTPVVKGYITLATRTNFKAEDIDEVADEYKKSVLDTDKIKAQYTLKKELPSGVVQTETQFITKKLTLVK